MILLCSSLELSRMKIGIWDCYTMDLLLSVMKEIEVSSLPSIPAPSERVQDPFSCFTLQRLKKIISVKRITAF